MAVGRSAVAVIAALAFAQSAAAAPPLKFLGTEVLSVSAKESADEADAFVSILNPGANGVNITADFQASSEGSVGAKFPPGTTIPGGKAKRVKVTFTGLDKLTDVVDGQLVVSGGSAPIAKSVSITPAPQPVADWPLWIVVGSLVAIAVAFLLVVYVIGIAYDGFGRLFLAAPGPKWSFQDSWATNVTVVGATLGTVLGAVTLPEVTRQIHKDTLIRLNLFFALLLAFAPLVFHVIRSPSRAAAREEGLWGFNIGLLLAASVTIAAVLGELATLALLFWELLGPVNAAWLVVGATVFVAVLAAVYFFFTVPFLASEQWSELREERLEAEVVEPELHWKLP
jgi:hypothetical protein